MKSICLILFFLSFSISHAQITTDGRMNDLKLRMNLSEIIELTGKEIVLKETEDSYNAEVQHKGIHYSLIFYNPFDSTNEKDIILNAIQTSDKKVKTLANTGIGNTLDEIWKVYKKQLLSTWMAWDWDKDEISSTQRVFEVYEADSEAILYFELTNNNVTSVGIRLYD